MITLLNMPAFKDRIDEAARDKGLTKSALAKLLDMSRSNMTHWFSGRAKDPKGDAVTRAAEILGVNALWLSAGKGPKHPTDKEGKVVKPIKIKPDSDVGSLVRMYDTMPPNIQQMARRQFRDLVEAFAPPSDANPYGQGKKKSATTKTAKAGGKRRTGNA